MLSGAMDSWNERTVKLSPPLLFGRLVLMSLRYLIVTSSFVAIVMFSSERMRWT